MARRWTLRRRVTALCVMVGLMLIVIAAAAAGIAAANRAHINALVGTTAPLHVGSERLMAALLNQQAGIRGYALSGNVADLQPYRDGLAQEEQTATEMIALLGDRPALRDELQAIRDLAQVWRNEVAVPVLRAVTTEGPAAALTLLSNSSSVYFDKLRTLVAQLQQDVVKLRDEVADDARSTSNGLVLLCGSRSTRPGTSGRLLPDGLDPALGQKSSGPATRPPPASRASRMEP